jgi:hypothetical protein
MDVCFELAKKFKATKTARPGDYELTADHCSGRRKWRHAQQPISKPAAAGARGCRAQRRAAGPAGSAPARMRTPEFHFRPPHRQLAAGQGARPGACARCACFRGHHRAVLAGDDLRPAALLRHRERLPRRVRRSRCSTSCARRTASCACRGRAYQPGRIDMMARQLGLAAPQPGRWFTQRAADRRLRSGHRRSDKPSAFSALCIDV